jgi:hypothetical protein
VFGRLRFPLAFAASLLALGACSDDPAGPRDDPRHAADDFEALADSLAGTGDPRGAGPMHHVATLLRLVERPTPITVRVDGAEARWLAVAEEVEFPTPECALPPNGGAWPDGEERCPRLAPPVMRSLIAWHPDEMRRIVRIVADPGTSDADDGYPDPMRNGVVVTRPGGDADTAVVFPERTWPGFLGEYFVRDRGIWLATEGRQSNSRLAGTTACPTDAVTTGWFTFACTRADFRFGVAMTVESVLLRDPIVPGGGDAVDPHRIEIAPQTVAGVRLVATESEAPPLPPPPPVTRRLAATLDARVAAGELHLALEVRNPGPEPVRVTFRDGQTYDFIVFGPENPQAAGPQAPILWQWSRGQGFTQALHAFTLAPGETRTYRERWTIPADVRGELRALGVLTSDTHRIAAGSKVVVP